MERFQLGGDRLLVRFPVNAVIERLKGLHLVGATLGLVVRINIEGELPALPNGPAAVRRAA